ncbi:ComEC/Rec2 family competence protein [Spiroplasma sp. SV19]|uniref:ComEC/Rec2 family competence protein n=1 Tax=Spiroplasma sp. SV19 TaxID=2570468 RepID=UPI0024B874A5|nr:ComEC/Rec2 family competence protein [Spiroplasma sp. SV19]
MLRKEYFILLGGIIIFNYLLLINSYYIILIAFVLIFILIWQQQKIYLWALILGIIISAILFYYLKQPNFYQNQIVSGQIQKKGLGYYYLQIGWKQYFLKTTINFELHDQVRLQGYYSAIISSPNIYELNLNHWLNANNIFHQFNVTKIMEVKTGTSVLAKITKFFNSYDDLTKDTISLILFGQKAKTTVDLYNGFVKMGVVHLLIVSGYHINILFYFLEKVFKRIFHRKIFFYFIYGFLFFYLYLLNFSFTSVKAVILLTLSLFNTHFLQKRLSSYQIWGLSVLLVLLFFPYSFLSSGFWYSFTVTLFIFSSQSKIKHYAFYKKLFYYNFMIFIVLLGWTMYFNYHLNFSSILFNLLLTPILVLIYLLSILIVWIPPCYFIYQYFYFLLSNYVVLCTKINLIWNVGVVNIGYIVLYYVMLLSVINNIGLWKKLFTFVLIVFLLYNGFQHNLFSVNYSMTMLNVGNGQTIVLQDNRTLKTVLYDVGVARGRSKQLVSNYLRWAGVNWVDAVFISHQHADHYNNLIEVQKHFFVKKIIQNDTYLKTIWFGGMKFTILHQSVNDYDENNNSLVILVEINNIRILLTGDISQKIELVLAAQDLWPVHLLQVAHHGSATSSSLIFLQKIKPMLCFISGEKTKHQNYPATTVWQNLQAVNCQIYFTGGKQNLQFNILGKKTMIKLF